MKGHLLTTGDGELPLVCYDACVFLAWFKKEADKDLETLGTLMRDVETCRVTLLMPVVVLAEVLDRNGSVAGTLFREFCERSGVLHASATQPIAMLAVQAREKTYDLLRQNKIKGGLKAPDALIAATAAYHEATVLYSYDPALIALSGSEELLGLQIRAPEINDDQLRLNFES